MFTLRRKGEFDAHLKGDLHCGMKKPFNRFQYEVEISVEDKGLDAQGFVLDNQAIQEYFDTTYADKPTIRSCEAMAKAATLDFRRMLGLRAKHCVEVCVRIFGIPTAHVEYMWRSDVMKNKTATV